MWEQRELFRPEVETVEPEEAVARALSARESPVFISDSGDNVTAGGAGDIPFFVERLLAAGAADAVVAGIADEDAVRRCAAVGVGGRITLSIGGKLDTIHGRPLEVTGTVRRLHPADAPTVAALQVEGVTILLAADRRAFVTRNSFLEAGIDPSAQKIVVVKLGYLFPELREIAARAVMALSPGFTDLRLERLPYRQVRAADLSAGP